MNGPQDLGGRMGFGPVVPEADEPVFHAEWEGRALGLTTACGSLRHWSIDESRHARECLPPAIYYSASYYEIWTRGLEALLLSHGLVSAEELERGTADLQPPHERRVSGDAIAAVLARGGPANRPIDTAPKFATGDKVRAKVMHPKTHTRMPGYLTGKCGVIESNSGGHVFPDTNAHGLGENPQRLYTVVFDGAEVWGAGAEPGLSISADLWESYLEPI